jgi:hypothetical protein
LWLKGNKFWACCKNTDESNDGCQYGEPKHHTSYYGPYGGGGKWACCGKMNLYCDGCTKGAHPGAGRAYEEWKGNPPVKSLEIFGRKF